MCRHHLMSVKRKLSRFLLLPQHKIQHGCLKRHSSKTTQQCPQSLLVLGKVGMCAHLGKLHKRLKCFKNKNNKSKKEKPHKHIISKVTYLFQSWSCRSVRLQPKFALAAPRTLLSQLWDTRAALSPDNPANCRSLPAASFIERQILCLARVTTSASDPGSLFHISWEILFMLQLLALPRILAHARIGGQGSFGALFWNAKMLGFKR